MTEQLKNFVDNMAEALYGRSLSEAHADKTCVKCGKSAIGFEDSESKQEYKAIGWCQRCQHKYFKYG
jgi:DNA-directed RNA polymerase subunit RPC12/RpoP